MNNINIDLLSYQPNEVKHAVFRNKPIEPKLNVIAVLSNPCNYAIRYILAREFIRRMELDEPFVNFYVVELVYGNQEYLVTNSSNPRHLQVRAETPLWHKENLINLGIRKLLPADWKAVAWLDADIEFENPYWAIDTLKLLNGTKDVVQLFSHAIHLTIRRETMETVSGFAYDLLKGKPHGGGFHPGFAYACTREAYEKMGGLFDKGILGGGDRVMCFSMAKQTKQIYKKWMFTEEYVQCIEEYAERVKDFRLGYISGIVRHYYHGNTKNRKYADRDAILEKYKYNPHIHLKYNEDGIKVPTQECPPEMLSEIMQYFVERNEDEDYLKAKEAYLAIKQQQSKLATTEGNKEGVPAQSSPENNAEAKPEHNDSDKMEILDITHA